MSNKFNWQLFERLPVIGIMRNFPEQHLEQVVTAMLGAGFSTLEITMNSVKPAETIQKLSAAWAGRMNIGAGTVLTEKSMEAALEAGATFIVTPVTDKKIIKACVKREVPVFPGAMTPTEIYKAWKWGASMVKVFPAGKLGPAYLKDVLEPLNEVKLSPTGGVSPENFLDFFRNGARAVGMATALFPKEMIAAERWDELQLFYGNLANQYRSFVAA